MRNRCSRPRGGRVRVPRRMHPGELADSLFHLGILSHEFMDVKTAEGRYREAIGLYQGAEGARAWLSMRVKFRLAWLLAMERRVDEAEKLFREVLRSRQAQLAPTTWSSERPARPDAGHARSGRPHGVAVAGPGPLRRQQPRGRHRHRLLAGHGVPPGARTTRPRSASTKTSSSSPGNNSPPRHLLLALLLGDMAGMYREIGDLARAVGADARGSRDRSPDDPPPPVDDRRTHHVRR